MANFSDKEPVSCEVQAASVLAWIVAEYGHVIIGDPQRVNGLLHEHCPEARREINLIMTTLREGMAIELANCVASPSSSAVLLVPHLVMRLDQDHGIATTAAQWAVETWAAALGVIPPGVSDYGSPLMESQAALVPVSQQGDFIEDSISAKTQDALVDALDNMGSTALEHAAVFGDAGKARILLDAGADVNKQGYGGWTALKHAARNGHVEVVRALLEAGADAGTYKDGAIIDALHSGNAETVRVLLEVGANPEERKTRGRDALMNAAHSNLAENVRLLLGAGVNVNGPDKTGQTPLMCMAFLCKTEMVHLLLGAGADVNLTDVNGHPALWFAQHPDFWASRSSKDVKKKMIALLKSRSSRFV